MKYARESDKDKKMAVISLGQGQEPIAKRAIDDAKSGGDWVLLQNCHLSRTFMPMLETLIEKFSDAEVIAGGTDDNAEGKAGGVIKKFDENIIHPEFRLY